jgi:hypothetical protein
MPKLRVQTVEWFAAESEMLVKLALVDHLAARAETDSLARDGLVAEYARLDPQSPAQLLLARKIESVLSPPLLKPVKDRVRSAPVFPPPAGDNASSNPSDFGWDKVPLVFVITPKLAKYFIKTGALLN